MAKEKITLIKNGLYIVKLNGKYLVNYAWKNKLDYTKWLLRDVSRESASRWHTWSGEEVQEFLKVRPDLEVELVQVV